MNTIKSMINDLITVANSQDFSPDTIVAIAEAIYAKLNEVEMSMMEICNTRVDKSNGEFLTPYEVNNRVSEIMNDNNGRK